MCGITGIYAFNLLGRMSMINLASATEKLAHRGPDFQNAYHDENVGLGHRRLSVIDTSPAGHQPMCDPSERYWLIFNGEVYNYREIRKELEESGVQFRNQTDTEVVLNLLIRDGEKALEKFNGFFSLAFYDRKEGNLLLAIDRFGIKPLYYYRDGDRFLFSSEMYSLVQYGLEKEIDYEALYFYLQLNYIPGPLTMLKGVSRMMPGQLLSVNQDKYEIETWYQPKVKTWEGDYESAMEATREVLGKSVERRLVSDVPLGAFLSGGLDSSVVSLLATREKEDLNTFSVCFSEEKYFDESDYSDLVAKHIGSHHHRFDLTQRKFEENVESILNSIGEPFADSSAIAYYLLSRETRGVSTVALSGDGADELFGGYNKHLAWSRIKSSPLANLAAIGASPFMYLLPASRSGAFFNKVRQGRRYAKAASLSSKERYWYMASLTKQKKAKSLLSDQSVEKISHEVYQSHKQRYLELLDKRGLNGFLSADQALVLPWDMLVKADRMSMAHGLEVRVPFLDHELVELANSMPEDYKVMGNQRKRILYDAYRDDLPPELYQRPKKGFEVPLLSWLKNSGIRYELAKLTDEKFLADQGIFDPKKVKKITRSLKSSSPSDNHARAWAILVFQWWWRRVMG